MINWAWLMTSWQLAVSGEAAVTYRDQQSQQPGIAAQTHFNVMSLVLGQRQHVHASSDHAQTAVTKAPSIPATMSKQRSTLSKESVDSVAKSGNNVEQVYRKISSLSTNWNKLNKFNLSSGTSSICFNCSKGRNVVWHCWATISNQHSTLSKESFDLQHSTMLLRHCCWCGRGLTVAIITTSIGRRGIVISVSVCLFVCLSVRSHISKTARPNFAKFSVHVTCARGSVFPRR